MAVISVSLRGSVSDRSNLSIEKRDCFPLALLGVAMTVRSQTAEQILSHGVDTRPLFE